MKRSVFTKAQREELAKLNVSQEQLSRLSDALPKCRRMLDEESKEFKPAMADVRDVLNTVLARNRESGTAMAKLVRGMAPASSEALDRVERESFKLEGGGTEIEAALHALAAANAVIRRALGALRESPVRRQSAAWGPVQVIHAALGDDVNFKPSSSYTSPFRVVVGVCYSAIHGKDIDPERSVKAYCRWLRTQRPAKD